MDFDDSRHQKKSNKVSAKPHLPRDSPARQRKLRFVGTSSTLASYLKSKDIEFKKKYGTPGNFIKTGVLPTPLRSTIQELYQKALQEERELHYAIHDDQNALFADDHSEATTEPENDQEHDPPQDEDEASIAPEAQAAVIIEGGGAAFAPPPEFQVSPEILRRIRKRIRELVKSEEERTEKIIKEWTEKWVQMYGELWDDCEFAVQHACETDPEYTRVSKDLNPLRLVEIFNRARSPRREFSKTRHIQPI